MKINNTNFEELSVDNPSTHMSEPSFKWDKTSNADGSFNYSISGYITSSIGTTIGSNAGLSFGLGKDIVEGQIINVNAPDFGLDIAYTLSLSNVGYRNWDGTTTGQITITHFDGNTLSVSFNFANVAKYTDNPLVGVDYLNNTVSGTFTSIKQ
jgi:hypothetical protein